MLEFRIIECTMKDGSIRYKVQRKRKFLCFIRWENQMLDWRNNSFIGELDDVYTTLFHPTYWDNISDCKKCIDLTIEADRKRISEEMHNTIINSRIL